MIEQFGRRDHCVGHTEIHIHPEVMPRGLHQPASWYYLLSCYKRWNIFLFIVDANIRLVRNATFYEPNIQLYFQLKSHDVCFQ